VITTELSIRLSQNAAIRRPGGRVPSPGGPGRPYDLAMDFEIPEEIEGQTSINELLIEMGEPPVENFVLHAAPDDASELFGDAPMLPGLWTGRAS
jgi:hypothetical protein